MIYSRNMPMTATYWDFLGVDAYGQSILDAPITIRCRWQDQAVLYKDAQGQQRVSSAIIYPAQEVAIKGWLKLGIDATTSPVGLAGAHEIQQVGQSPSLDNRMRLLKVYL